MPLLIRLDTPPAILPLPLRFRPTAAWIRPDEPWYALSPLTMKGPAGWKCGEGSEERANGGCEASRAAAMRGKGDELLRGKKGGPLGRLVAAGGEARRVARIT
jgi:hypothetical protein